ncbi:MAG: SdpI family protein [Oscillospiraceae bacterium]|nr:SdpI family protein [Oscillospiraceae bacterium]
MGNYIFWIMMLLFMLLIPGVMIFFGIEFQKAAPKNINWAYGYRTQRSTKNRDTWVFAHKCIGGIWKSWGIALTPISIIPLFFVLGRDVETVGNLCIVLMGVQLVFLIVPIFIVESRLKKTFDKYGRRK